MKHDPKADVSLMLFPCCNEGSWMCWRPVRIPLVFPERFLSTERLSLQTSSVCRDM